MASYAAYGFVLSYMGLFLSGMAEGPRLAEALFGSPLTIVPYFPAQPVFWGWIGYCIGARKRLAGIVSMGIHYLVAPTALLANLRIDRSLAEEWATAQWQHSEAPVFSLLLWTPYIVGSVVTWVLLVRIPESRPTAPRRTDVP